MATQEQLNTVRKLHEQNDRTLGGYKNGQYNITNGTTGKGDPYEAYHAKMAGGLLTPDATVNTITVNAGTPDYTIASFDGSGVTFTSTVTFNNAVGGEDESVTWSLGTITGVGTYSINSSGVVVGTGTTTADDTIDVIATSNFDGTSTDTLTVTVVA